MKYWIIKNVSVRRQGFVANRNGTDVLKERKIMMTIKTQTRQQTTNSLRKVYFNVFKSNLNNSTQRFNYCLLLPAHRSLERISRRPIEYKMFMYVSGTSTALVMGGVRKGEYRGVGEELRRREYVCVAPSFGAVRYRKFLDECVPHTLRS